MNEEDNMYGPFTIDLMVYITDGDKVGKITWSGPISRPMLPEDIKSALIQCTDHVKDTMGSDWRLSTKTEFFEEIMEEKTGTRMNFTPPGKAEWNEWVEVK